MTQTLIDRALIEEATKKSALIWVSGPVAAGGPGPDDQADGAGTGSGRALWHVWHQGAACLVGGGPGEQPLEGLGLVDGGPATVTVRSKDNGGRLVVWSARVVELAAGSEAWTAAVDELRGKRLNAPDADRVVERWARECRVLRLEPEPEPVAALPTDSQAARPLPSWATTRHPMPAGVPKLLLRGRGRVGRGRRGGGRSGG